MKATIKHNKDCGIGLYLPTIASKYGSNIDTEEKSMKKATIK